MNAGRIHSWMKHPEQLNRDTLYELRTLLGKYPWFQTARLLYLKNLYLLHDPAFGDELRKAALYVANRQILFNLLEMSPGTIAPAPGQAATPDALPPEEPGLDRTLTLIDAFLSTLPQEEPLPTELDYASDYTHYLLQEEAHPAEEPTAREEVRLRGAELIDRFIQQTEEEYSLKIVPEAEECVEKDPTPLSVPSENEEEDSYFTETLAKIYVKQQRYAKALEIIKKLSLKYPKKNAYFADQIRFLEKLIINAKSK